MRNLHTYASDKRGFILVTAMVMMIILSLIGVFALKTTTFEMKLAGNDKVIKETFYRADGGLQTGTEVIEQNLGCPSGFTSITTSSPSATNPDSIGGVDIYDNTFAYHEVITDVNGASASVKVDDLPSDAIRGVRIPNDPTNRVDTEPHTNLVAWGKTEYLAGSGLQMAAGYEGKGKSASGLGAVIKYNLHSQHLGTTNSEALIQGSYWHTVGMEGNCLY